MMSCTILIENCGSLSINICGAVGEKRNKYAMTVHKTMMEYAQTFKTNKQTNKSHKYQIINNLMTMCWVSSICIYM